MNEQPSCGKLQQLVNKDDNQEQLYKNNELKSLDTPGKTNKQPDDEIHTTDELQEVVWGSKQKSSSVLSKESSSQTTISHGNQSQQIHNNDKEKEKSSFHEVPRINKQPKEVPDVRHMEQALLQLLEDFHSGNLRAFGKDCSMEQMTEIREQQEQLARLHFEMGQLQDIHGTEQYKGFSQSSDNMHSLLQRLEQLSVCIEKLHNK